MKKHTQLIHTVLIAGILSYAPVSLAQAWEDLSSESKEALRPLRLNWDDLSPAQKRSWLNRVPEIKSMPGEQRNTAQARMAEWGALSQQQRYEVKNRVKNSVEADPSARARLWSSFISQ